MEARLQELQKVYRGLLGSYNRGVLRMTALKEEVRAERGRLAAERTDARVRAPNPYAARL
jgi:hypothetical protein